jgi:hypothetical protein
VHTLQAAVWTTIAELCDDPKEHKACLVFEYMPIHALQPLVDDWVILKSQTDKTRFLPEIDRVSLSMVGKGAGPAILIEVANETALHSLPEATSNLDDGRITAAMKSFVNRMVVGEGACPHLSSSEEGPTGIVGVAPKAVAYKACQKSDAFHVLSSFWNSVCELYASPDTGTLILSLPLVGSDRANSVESNHARFAGIAELLSRFLCLYKGDGVYDLLHFHPDYTRDWISPAGRPAHGHLPPTTWLRAMMIHNGDVEAAARIDNQDMQLSNYQRRSPLPAVCIKRVEYLEKATDADNGVVQLNVDGALVLASGVPTYSRNTMRLIAIGEDKLRSGLLHDKGLLSG